MAETRIIVDSSMTRPAFTIVIPCHVALSGEMGTGVVR